MIAPRLWPLVIKEVVRRRTRTALTILGVAVAMFLFTTIEAVQRGTREATRTTGQDTVLVVFRKNRYCPFTSRLPESYLRRLEDVDGVAEVIPMRIVVSNCRTSLDVVTFRGVPAETAAPGLARRLSVRSGSIDEWRRRTDAAMLGEVLARRRGLAVGDRFDANGLTVHVAAIVASNEPQDRDVAYVHLSFLQRAARSVGDGVVTQFNVVVDDPERLEDVARAIDAEFAHDADPTTTSSEKAFVARAAGDLMALIDFTLWVALGCVLAVLGLVANTIVLSVRDRIREHAIFQTLGYRPSLVGRLVLAEGMFVAALGGLVGSGAALGLLWRGQYSLGNEGLSIQFAADPRLLLTSLAVSVAVGALAGLVPAFAVARRPIAGSLAGVA